MNVTGVIIAAAVVGVIGLVIGLLLGVAGELFKVKVDEREMQVRDLLPGVNCGACGYAGCDGLAAAIAASEAPVDGCPVGGPDVAKAVGAVMGVSAEEKEKQVAFVKCAGTCDKAASKYEYHGLPDCRMASVAPGKGEKKCTYGCMGFGTCVKACPFDAIHIVDGIALVDKEKCVACGKCISSCPNQLIELVPYKSQHIVACSSHDKGKQVKEACSTGCIGCTLCVKQCEFEAIRMDQNLAVIDYNKCTNCGKCAEKCPVKVITKGA